MSAPEEDLDFDEGELTRLVSVIADHLYTLEDPVGTALALIKVLDIDMKTVEQEEEELAAESRALRERSSQGAGS